jgi:hypothetical protein
MDAFTIDNFDINTLASQLKENEKYLVNVNNTTNDLVERFTFNIVNYHALQRNIDINNDTHSIEICLCNNNTFQNDFDKKLKCSPIFSIILFLNENNEPFILTKIDTESYKYKEIPDVNNLYVIVPQTNNHIIFDSSKYYGNILFSETKYVKINVWDKKLNDHVKYNTIDGHCLNHELSINPIDKSLLSKTIIDYTIMETLLYDKTSDRFSKLKTLYEVILNNKDSHIFNITITKFDNNNNYENLENEYGTIAKDLYPFYNNKISLDESNRFYNNKILQKLLSIDTCYWIIDEAEKKKWSDSPYPNYHDYMNIENLPSVMNYVLYVSRFWLSQIRNLYDMNNVNINIKDIFITKYSKHMIGSKKNIDNTFLTINIQLNDEVDYIGGDIDIENYNIKLKQGDLLVYNGKKLRSNGNVTDGTKYVLVLFTEVNF